MIVTQELNDQVDKTIELASKINKDDLRGIYRLNPYKARNYSLLVTVHAWDGFTFRKKNNSFRVRLGFFTLSFYGYNPDIANFQYEFGLSLVSHVAKNIREPEKYTAVFGEFVPNEKTKKVKSKKRK